MIDFVLPSLGADMDQATLVGWLVEPGETVEHGQVIAEVETDKGIIEIECWHDGVVDELLREPSPEKLPVGTLLARIRPIEERSHEEAAEQVVIQVPMPASESIASAQPPPTPPIRHLAHSLGVDLTGVGGTGRDGSVTREDVRREAERLHPLPGVTSRELGGRPKASPRARRLSSELGLDLTAATTARPDGLVTHADVLAAASTVPEREDKGAAMRRAIARSMTRSKREIPHYYLATQIDLATAMAWLEAENDTRSISARILPAVLLLKASALAVREVPELNGHWIDDRFEPAPAVHLGVAVSLRDGGLVAPAIHNADQLELGELMESLRDLVTRARSWRLRSSEMSDPTITVTNLGDRGVQTAFPVIIPPQVAMVGFGRVSDAVVAIGGSPVVHPVVHATLAADHRATDGHRGGLFLSALDRLLQEPASL